jgi:hypothetical protein
MGIIFWIHAPGSNDDDIHTKTWQLYHWFLTRGYRPNKLCQLIQKAINNAKQYTGTPVNKKRIPITSSSTFEGITQMIPTRETYNMPGRNAWLHPITESHSQR